jgi:hypothetical protein
MKLTEEIRNLLEAPLARTQGTSRIGTSLWLYLSLVLTASTQGIVVQSRARLADRLQVAEPEIDRWLTLLVGAKLVDVRSPSPYLVISLPFWPRNSELADSLHREVPVSSSYVRAATFIKKQQRDGGPGEGAELLAEARAILGESETAELEELFSHHPMHLIRRALHRVRLTPPDQIRKSKAALFRFLLAKFSNDSNAHSSTHHPHP